MKRDPKIVEPYKKELVEILMLMAQDKRALNDFLADILTPAEYREVANRWQIMKKLKTKKTQREIADELGIGLATVNRGVRTLLNPAGGFNQALGRIK